MNDDAPRFSIVIPTHNRAALLESAIESVLAQTVADWELVVVDDGSTDHVARVVEARADPRIRLVRRDENGGVAAAQNTGLAASGGTFVAFLHSDDRFAPNKLHAQGLVLEAAAHDVLAVESAIEVDRGAGIVPPRLGGVQAEDLLAFSTGVHVLPMLFRRDAVAELGFDPNLRAWEDWDLLVRLLLRGRVVTTDDVVGELRRSGDDRLERSPSMVYGLEYLLERYGDELAARPRVRAIWHLKLGRAYFRSGDLASARRHLLHCVRDDLRRAPVLVPAAATLIGNPVAVRAWRAYERLGRRRRRR